MRDLFFLTCGTLRGPSFIIGPSVLAPPTRITTFSNTVGVAVRDSGDVVLVDAGWSEAQCAGTVRLFERWRGRALGVRARAKDAIVVQLRALGIDAKRVVAVIATHLHLDHIGGLRDFPNAELVCTETELAAYRAGGRTVVSPYTSGDVAPNARVRAVALDAAPTYGFPASHDLYKDGEIVLLDARGHTKGSVAVALRTHRGGPEVARRAQTFVHIGDAAYSSWEFAQSSRRPSLFARVVASDLRELSRTHACIRACEADPRQTTIVPSHDVGVFEKLPHAPVLQ